MNNLRQTIRSILLEQYHSGEHRSFYADLNKMFKGQSVSRHMDLHKSEGRKIKSLFAQYADQYTFEQFALVHWVGKPETLLKWVGRHRDELSCGIHDEGDVTPYTDYGAFGLWVEGRVTLAVWDQDDAVTGFQSQFTSEDPEEQKKLDHAAASSGRNKQPMYARDPRGEWGEGEREWGHGPYILNQNDIDYMGGVNRHMVAEALVDNWSAKGIIIPEWEFSDNEEVLARAAKEFGVPVYDTDCWTKFVDKDGNIL